MARCFIPVSKPHIAKLEEELILDAVRSGWVSSIGKYIEEFERTFAAFCRVKYALTVSNGTTGLHLALASLGVGPGDEVIIPDLTFVATANSVLYVGATPVMADVDPETLCLNARTVEPLIGPRTRAVIPVHLYGHPAEMDGLMALAKRHNLLVIEDAAEAHGAEYNARRTGSLGDCGVFSFYGNKIITTGEGGMLTTDDHNLYVRAKMLRDHAMHPERRYWHTEVGYNYRMTNLQAALGQAQMGQIDQFLEKRIQIMEWYRQAIATSDSVRLNRVANWAKSAFWMVCLEVDWFDEAIRAKFMAALKEQYIDSRPYFNVLSCMPMYERDSLPVSAEKSRIGLNLPTYFDLSQEDVGVVAAAVNKTLATLKP